jgi:hypothetical protein
MYGTLGYNDLDFFEEIKRPEPLMGAKLDYNIYF